jgi:hypothetical protein
MAGPNSVATGVDAVVIRDLVTGGDITQRNHQAPGVHCLHISIRIARVVDVPFGRLHEHHLAGLQIVAVTRIVARSERMEAIDDTGIVDDLDNCTLRKRPCGKDPEPLDCGGANGDVHYAFAGLGTTFCALSSQ